MSFEPFEKYNESHSDISALLIDLGKRSGLKDILQFAYSYAICEEIGGDIEAVCLKNASMLLDKMDFQTEIKALISEKKLDAAVLAVMPLFILYFLNVSSDDYIQIMYTSTSGKILMTVSLLLFAAAVFWGVRIVNIKI